MSRNVSPPPYTPQPHRTHSVEPHQEEDLLESLQNLPSNFDLALNVGTSLRPPSPGHAKRPDASLLDPDGFRRLSMGTISSIDPQSRGISPYPPSNDTRTQPKGFRIACKSFWHRNQGPFLVTFAQFFGALMNVTTRYLELQGEGMHPLQILFARMSLTMLICYAWMWWKNIPDFLLGARDIRWLLVLRGFTGFCGIYGVYYSLQYLPLADAIVLTFLAPSVASYGCYLFLKEPFPRPAQLASLISLAGVVLIARPTSFVSAPETPSSSTHTNSTSPMDSPHSGFPMPTSAQRLSAVAVAMLGVLGTAGVFTTIRWIGKRAHPLISVNYFAVFCTLISTLSLTLARPLHLSTTLSFRLPISLQQWELLFLLGICGFITQFLLTMGLAVGGRQNGARSTNMIYTNMLFALIFDKIIFDQTPDGWSLAGGGLILVSAIFVAMQKQQLENDTRIGDEEADGLIRESGTGGEEGTPEEEMGILGISNGEREEDEESVENRLGQRS